MLLHFNNVAGLSELLLKCVKNNVVASANEQKSTSYPISRMYLLFSFESLSWFMIVI